VKILIDECLPIDFRLYFPEHEAHTVQFAGFKSKKNGELLRAAEQGGYDVLLTVDQGLPHQSAPDRNIAIVLIRTETNQLEDLIPFVPNIERALASIRPGSVVRIP
jgi:predicted nuclease of predicted toxin-antitoxin system